MDFTFLSQADEATLRLEMAKRAIEIAKAEFEQAKLRYEETLAQAEEHGLTKAKLKKLTEERVNALFETGMVDLNFANGREAKAERPPKEKSEGKSKSKASKQEMSAPSSVEQQPEESSPTPQVVSEL